MNIQNIEPQQGFPEQKQMPAQLPERKLSATGFLNFLRNIVEHIDIEQAKTRQLTEMAVIVHRRFRALTVSDLFSRYGTRAATRGVFLEYDQELDGEVHPISIVQSAIRANTNACLQSSAEVKIKSSNASAKNKQISDRWQRVADYFERTTESEEERSFIYDGVQKEGAFLKQVVRERSDEQTTARPVVSEKLQRIAALSCEHCNFNGLRELADTEAEGKAEGMELVPCPKCGNSAHGLIKTLKGFDLEEQIDNLVNIGHKIFTSFNFVIDAYGAKTKGLDSAKWLQIHELVTRAELEADYPQIEFGSPWQWNYQLQAEYALAQQDWSLLNYQWNHGSPLQEFDRFEKRSIYLHEDCYRNRREPEDFEFVNARGVKVLSVRRGQSIAEAYEAQYGYNPKGLKFIWCDDRLIDIVSPEEEEVNFRECFSAIHWLRDSSGFYSVPFFAIVTIADDLTLLNTMNHNITAGNAAEQVVYNSLVWEREDFNNQYLGTKNAALLEGGDISKSVYKIPGPTVSPHVINQIQFLWGVKDDITAVQPAMRGASQRGETFGAQRQQLEQAYGNLTSVLKSDAQAKVRSTKQKCNVAKKYWTLEQFQRVASMFNEIWTEEDVMEMCQADFEADLIFDYRQGSEMPQSNLAREMKFFQGISQLLPLVQANPALLTDDKMQRLLAKVDEFAGFDFDLTGLEIDDLISQKRIVEFALACADYADVTTQQIEGMRMQIVSLNEMNQPITQFDLIIEDIFRNVDIGFSKRENLPQQAIFFTEQYRTELGKAKPNRILLEVLNIVVDMIEQAVMQITGQVNQQALENDPEMIKQKLLAEQSASSEKEKSVGEREVAKEDAEKAHERKLEEKQLDKDADMEKMQLQNVMNWQNQGNNQETANN